MLFFISPSAFQNSKAHVVLQKKTAEV